MRWKRGRPDLAEYSHLFDVPEAGDGLAVTFLGVSSLLLDDGESALLTDGFCTRPGLGRVLLGRIAPDERRVDTVLERAGIGSLEAVLPVHDHFDHALDSAVVARKTGALLVGGQSTANLGRGAGLPEDRIVVPMRGVPVLLGAWTVTLVASAHCPPDRFPGEITAPVVPPVRASAYRCGEAWSLLVRHRSGYSALVVGSAGFVAGALSGQSAQVAYLGVGQLGLMDEGYLTSYWEETVRCVGARRVVLTHWDDFFRPLPGIAGAGPLRALPYAGDDLDVSLRVLGRLADQDGVALSMPTVWQREDPWR